MNDATNCSYFLYLFCSVYIGMYYHFIEIGTSDFDTQVQTCPDHYRGLSIDPMMHLLNRLPDKPHVRKIACAIGEKEDEQTIYYIPLETIQASNLPQWVRGCNSIGGIHKDFVANKIEHMVTSMPVKVRPLRAILQENDVSRIGFLKVDTEGYDYVILRAYLDLCAEHPNLYAKYIEFEHMTAGEEANTMIDDILSKGYDIIASTIPGNTLVRRRLDDC